VIRKITAGALRPGMYIYDLGCSWVDHPFLRSRFLVRSESEVQKILDAGITEVSIDTERGDEPPDDPRGPNAAALPRNPERAHSARADSTTATVTRLVRGGRTAAPAPGSNEAPRAHGSGASVSSVPGNRAAAPHDTNDAPPRQAASPRVSSVPDIQVAAARGIPIATTALDTSAPASADDAPAPIAQPTGKSRQQPAAATIVLPPSVPDPVRIAGEFQEAKRVHVESCRVVKDMLHDVRLGKQVSMERTHEVVTNIAESILRDPGPLLALCRLKQKDEYTFQHSVSVSALLMVFARAAGYDEAAIREAGVGGLLHDIGKMAIPLDILNKPGVLTAIERQAMHTHVEAGTAILCRTPGVNPIALHVAAEHHERHDGSGYLKWLKAEEISRMGRMAAIVDVYDALTSDRVYHRALTPAEALKFLLERSGTHVDPELVQLLIKTLGIYPTGSLVMLESGRLAIVVEQKSGNLLYPRVRVVYDTRKSSFVTPFDVDLARAAGHGGEDRIVRHESPLKWSVDPIAYLLEKVA
jgi:putative nucleotidyltransferase with HDIG domain